MPENVSHFVVVAEENRTAIAHACRMLRQVDHVVALADGTIFVLLEQRLRDETEHFGALEKAVKAIAGVQDIIKGFERGYHQSRLAFEMAEKVAATVDAMQPAAPQREAEFAQFVCDMRAWRRSARAVHNAAYDAVRE